MVLWFVFSSTLYNQQGRVVLVSVPCVCPFMCVGGIYLNWWGGYVHCTMLCNEIQHDCIKNVWWEKSPEGIHPLYHATHLNQPTTTMHHRQKQAAIYFHTVVQFIQSTSKWTFHHLQKNILRMSHKVKVHWAQLFYRSSHSKLLANLLQWLLRLFLRIISCSAICLRSARGWLCATDVKRSVKCSR